jgi:AcrR family transcriptional regulator
LQDRVRNDGDMVAEPVSARPGVYAPGVEAAEQILRAAVNLLIEEGYAAFTLRKIADRCGLKVGNISYYFPTKQSLLSQLLEDILADYHQISDRIYGAQSLTAEEKLSRLLVLWLEDIQTRWTTNLFTELWAMANHDRSIAEKVDTFYQRGQDRLRALIAEINPGLPDVEQRLLSAYVASCMEGTTLFAGFNKPWADKMPWMAGLAVRSVLDLVRTATAADMRALSAGWRYVDAEGKIDTTAMSRAPAGSLRSA